jgi:hypothetical protein
MWQFMQGVREGTLDYTPTKPEDIQVLVSVPQIGGWRIIDILLGMIVLVVVLRPEALYRSFRLNRLAGPHLTVALPKQANMRSNLALASDATHG